MSIFVYDAFNGVVYDVFGSLWYSANGFTPYSIVKLKATQQETPNLYRPFKRLAKFPTQKINFKLIIFKVICNFLVYFLRYF